VPSLTFKATEMKDARVDRISLVERGATRMPIKIIKEDSTMKSTRAFDLASVFKGTKKPVTPELVGVVTLKSDSFEAVKVHVAEAGFSVAKADEHEDQSVVFKQGESEMPAAEDVTLIRLNEHAVVAMKGFRPYNMDMDVSEGTSFADVCKAQGFYPGVGTMIDVLRGSVLQVAEKSDDPSNAATMVSKMFDEAKAYAVSLVTALPSKAFKLENMELEEVAPVAKTSGEGSDTAALALAAAEAEKAKVAVTEPAAVAKAAADAAAALTAAPAKTAEELAAEAAAAVVVKAEEKVVAPDVAKIVAEAMAGMTTTVTGLIDSVKKSVDGLTVQVKEVAVKADAATVAATAATAAVNGTVLGGDVGDGHQTTRKSDTGGKGREIDTAFAPRRRAA
jgi:hypothetical protein